MFTRFAHLMLTSLLLAALPACLPAQSPDMRAPDLASDEWLNTDRPLRSFKEDLKGQVVLLDFWTYCCINCIHVLPDLEKLEVEFADEPFQVIGVHSNKFPQEGEAENIRQAILRYKIQHPVVVDNDHKIWQSYGVRAWPTLVLIDAEGNIVGQASGEGNYDTLRVAIRSVLAANRKKGVLADGPLKLVKEVKPDTELYYPAKVLADGEQLYVADSANDRILRVDAKTGDIKAEIAPPTDETPLHHPHGMALRDGWLYIADTDNHLLRRVELATNKWETLAGTGKQARPLPKAGPGLETRLNSPWALEWDGDLLHIAMAGSHQLWTYHTKSGRVSPLAGNGYENIIDGPATDAQLAQPSGFARIGRQLYFADSEVSAIRAVDLAADEVNTLVGTHLFRFGDRDGTGIDEVLLQHPLGLAVWKDKLLVADTYNNKIKLLDPKTKRSQTLYGTGEEDLATDRLTMWEPGGIDVQGDNLYIADTNHHRILHVDLATKEWRVVIGPTGPAPAEATPAEGEAEPAAPMTPDK